MKKGSFIFDKNHAEDFGDGIFVIRDYYNKSYHYTIYNKKTHKMFMIDDSYIASDRAVRGIIYGRQGGYISFDGENQASLPYHYAIFPDGRFCETEEFTWATDGKLIKKCVDHIEILDTVRHTRVSFPLPNLEIEDIKFDGNYALVKLIDSHEKRYFTVIDKNGTQRFEPIPYHYRGPKSFVTSIDFSEGIVIYCSMKNENTLLCAMDTKGNQFISESDGFVELSAFRKNRALVKRENGEEGFIKKRFFGKI